MAETCDECKADVAQADIAKCEHCVGCVFCKKCFDVHSVRHLMGELNINVKQELDVNGEESRSMTMSRIDKSKDELTSPSTIKLIYKTKDGEKNDEILFGIQGSRVGIALSQISDKNTGDYYYHFGLVLSGNDYTITDKIYNSEFKKKHYMLFHLLKSALQICVCATKDDIEKELNSVWASDTEGEKVFQLHDLGHSVLSVECIMKFLNNEKDNEKIEYIFSEFQDSAKNNKLKDDYKKEKIEKMTNCFMFVIKFIKLLNLASHNKSKIPNGKNIVDWTDESSWKYPKEFKSMWDHCVQLCQPQW